MEFKEILNRKIEHYGKTEAAYEFAAEEYANKLIKEAQSKQLNITDVSRQFCDCVKEEWDGADVNGDCIICGRKHK